MIVELRIFRNEYIIHQILSLHFKAENVMTQMCTSSITIMVTIYYWRNALIKKEEQNIALLEILECLSNLTDLIISSYCFRKIYSFDWQQMPFLYCKHKLHRNELLNDVHPSISGFYQFSPSSMYVVHIILCFTVLISNVVIFQILSISTSLYEINFLDTWNQRFPSSYIQC